MYKRMRYGGVLDQWSTENVATEWAEMIGQFLEYSGLFCVKSCSLGSPWHYGPLNNHCLELMMLVELRYILWQKIGAIIRVTLIFVSAFKVHGYFVFADWCLIAGSSHDKTARSSQPTWVINQFFVFFRKLVHRVIMNTEDSWHNLRSLRSCISELRPRAFSKDHCARVILISFSH